MMPYGTKHAKLPPAADVDERVLQETMSRRVEIETGRTQLFCCLYNNPAGS